MDIQPGPVQVEKIISRQPGGKAQQVASAASSSSGTKAPTMDTASLRQWQQFMACSRTTEVGHCGRRAREDTHRLRHRRVRRMAPGMSLEVDRPFGDACCLLH